MNTEPDIKSYKGIAPIFMQGREPGTLPYPNTLIFAKKSVSFVFVIVITVILLNGY